MNPLKNKSQCFGVVKVSEFFKPEHKEHFNSLYPYDPEIVDAYKLPEDKKDASKLSKQKAKISIRKNETTKEQPLEEIAKEDALANSVYATQFAAFAQQYNAQRKETH